MTRYTLTLYFSFCLTYFISAQNADYQINVTAFTEKDGLSNNDVFCINKDARGVLWVGTRYGLNRFDGKGFRTFTAADGLKNNFVSAIFPMDERHLLLCLGEPNSDKIAFKDFQLFDIYAPDKTPFFEQVFPKTPFNAAEIRYISPQKHGFLFVLKNHKRYFLNKKKEWTIFDFITKNEEILSHIPQKYTWTKQVQKTNLVLKKYGADKKVAATFRTENAAQNNLFWLNEDAKGNAFFLQTIEKKLYQIQIIRITVTNKKTVIHTFTANQTKDFFPRKSITHAAIQNGYWLASPEKTVMFSENWQPKWHIPTDLHGIILQGRQNYFEKDKIWQCSSKGVQLISVDKNKFNAYMVAQSPTPFRRIVRSGTDLFLSSEQGIYQQRGQQLSYFSDKIGLAMIVLKDSTLLTGNFKKLYRFDLNNNNVRSYNIEGHEIWALWQDADGKIWWSEEGLKRFDLKKQLSVAVDYQNFEALAKATVYHFYPLSPRRVWLCTTEGLFEFDPKSEKITARYWTGGKGKFYLPTNDLRHLYPDKKTGDFWLATGQTGLLRWQPNAKKTQLFRFSNNSTNITHAVYADDFGFLWLPTDNGIVQFDKKTERFRIYRQSDGLPTNEFNRISHLQDADGSFYFGSMNGVVHFHPKDFKNGLKNGTKTKLFVVEASQYEGKKDTVADKTADFLAQNRLIIRPKDRFFTLTFGLNEYALARDAVYFYQIKGDAAWQVSEKNQLTFWRLPYGKQTIFVKARLTNGDFSAVFPVAVWVKRPFYLQIWFVLFMIALLAVGIVWRVNILRQQNQTLEKEVLKRTEQIRKDKLTIEKQAAELQQLDEMKSRFFANISHELRTPLTLIASPLQKLEGEEANPEKRQFLRFAVKNSKRLLRLVNDILDLTKLEAAKLNVEPQKVQVLAFVRRVLAEFESFAAHKGVLLALDADISEAATAFFDVKKVETVLYNLLSNALKFTPKDRKVILKLKIKADGLCFEITDTGRGIAAEDLPHVFDRFYQSKKQQNAEGGTGIGLAICKEFAVLMKGNLTVKSELDRGTSFEFWLPTALVDKEMLEIDLKEKVEQDFKTSSAQDLKEEVAQDLKEKTKETPLPHLLLVEDNEDLQQYISVLLQDDYRLTVTDNGKNALDFLNACATENRPALILSDIMMPEMDGFQLLQHLKNTPAFRQIPVIMLTARAGADDRLKALRIGVDDYLTKPFLEEELLARINNLLQNAAVRLDFGATVEKSALGEAEEKENLPSEWLKTVENYILNNMQTPTFSVGNVAEAFGVSRQLFNRRIGQEVGMTALNYIQEIQLNEARRLLENRLVPNVRDLAAAVGFSNPKLLSRKFAERFGKYPSDYF